MSPRKTEVRQMFNDISRRYDFLNHFLSFGIDRRWRARVRREIRDFAGTRLPELRILDVATGTGDLAIALARLKPASVTGIDIAGAMLGLGREKVAQRRLEGLIAFREADAEHIPFPDDSFDAVTVAFGVRNYENLSQGLSEMRRVMKPGGLMLILEFSHPERFPFRQVFGFYSSHVIPLFGRLVSGSPHAYTYLPASVAAFPSGTDFLRIMEIAGLGELRQIPLTGGVATLYSGKK
jgi:demethylmenaquinone methyltransferase/2-methoxy-6-polyprenyl-1,4-benzoquinol methylase